MLTLNPYQLIFFGLLFLFKVQEIWCVSYIPRTSMFRLAPLQVLIAANGYDIGQNSLNCTTCMSR